VAETEVLFGDVVEQLRSQPEKRYRTCVTSPPYYQQRRYMPVDHPLAAREIGWESTVEDYVDALCAVFREVHRVLTDDGTLWVNIANCHAGSGRGGSIGKSSRLSGAQSAQTRSREARNWWRMGRHRLEADGKGRRVPNGFRTKELLPVAWLLGLALHEAGWYLRLDNVWHKPNGKPESVEDRPTVVHEYVLLLSKRARYYYDQDAIREPHRMRPQRRPNGHKPRRAEAQPDQTWSTTARDDPGFDGHPLGRNARSVWPILTVRGEGDHAAPMPPELARRCVLAGSAIGDWVLDPFGGQGTVGIVANEEGRNATLIDLDERACELARSNTRQLGAFGRSA